MLPRPATTRWSLSAAFSEVFLPGRLCASMAGVEFIAQRLRPERAQQRLLLELGARHQLHRAEAARIVEGDGCAVRHVKHHMVVRRALSSARDNRRPACASLPTRNEPDMPRCISSTSPDDRSASRYFARRPRPSTVLPGAAASRSPWRAASAGGGRAPRPWRSARLPWRAPGPAARSRLRAVRAWLILRPRALTTVPGLRAVRCARNATHSAPASRAMVLPAKD